MQKRLQILNYLNQGNIARISIELELTNAEVLPLPSSKIQWVHCFFVLK